MAVLAKVAKYVSKAAKNPTARKAVGLGTAKFAAKVGIFGVAAREEYKRVNGLPDASPPLVSPKYDTPRTALAAGGLAVATGAVLAEAAHGLLAHSANKKLKMLGKLLGKVPHATLYGGLAVGLTNLDAAGRTVEHHFDDGKGNWKPGFGSKVVGGLIEGEGVARNLMSEAQAKRDAAAADRSPSKFGTPRKGPASKADLKNGWWVQKANGKKYWRRANER